MISSPQEITRAWLSVVLKTPVAAVTARRNPAFNSTVTNLEVTYPGEADLPRNILVKLNQDHEGQNEIQFYRFAQDLNLSMLTQPLGMDDDPQSGCSFLVLEDVSNTHAAPVTREQLVALRGVPSREHMDSMIDCLAQLHAAFWEHPRFGTVPETTEMRWWYRDEESHRKHIERRRLEWARLIEMHGEGLPRDWLELGATTLQKLPLLFENIIQPRLSLRRALTMSQGDCYLTQFLVPRAAPGHAYPVDFRDACVNFPTYDLVYMLETFWSREQRALNENYCLHRYQSELNRRSIRLIAPLLETKDEVSDRSLSGLGLCRPMTGLFIRHQRRNLKGCQRMGRRFYLPPVKRAPNSCAPVLAKQVLEPVR